MIARTCERVLGGLALGVFLVGCATACSRGREAFQARQYAAAAREFEAAAAGGTRPRDALSGRAREVLHGVLAEEPKRGEARLYAALAGLGLHQDARALEALEILRPQ